MRCVAFGCSKTHSDGVSFHIFPSEEKLRREWTRAVQKTRAKWSPTKYSALCSEHFEADCYESMCRYGKEIGVDGKLNRRLKKNMVPTIFPKPKTPAKEKRRSTAYEKREHLRVLETVLESPKTVDSATVQEVDENVPMPEQLTSEKETQTTNELVHCACCYNNKPKKKRKNSSFQWNGRPRMMDKGMQIFPEKPDETPNVMPVIDVPFDQSSDESVEDESDYDDDYDIDDDGDNDQRDPDYIPCEEEDADDFELNDNDDGGYKGGRKFMVFEEQLLAAFSTCLMCGHPTTRKISAVIGTFCRIKQCCMNCNFERLWSSQPFLKDVPAGNLLLSAAILLSGSCIAKSLRLFRHLGMVAVTSQTFNDHQKFYLLPSIKKVWKSQQEQTISSLKENNDCVVLGGDGRADSPGHSAKYGSYTLMDLKLGRIVDVQIVQSNEVGSSYHMEKEGLIRSVKYLEEKDISIGTLVTDRHCQIKKWVRENLPDTVHKFDLWHIAKGVSKKLEAVAKLASGKSLKPWIHSISNHLYWSATSTVDGDGEMMLAKWKSVGRHIQNIHTGHSENFPDCEHGELEGKERKKKWMTPGSITLLKTLAIINNTRLCKDIVMMSEKYQTSKLESFHSTLNHFAPKMTHFSYWGQTCRCLLAALHYNENSGREQAVTAEGKNRFRIAFPKFKKGGYSVRTVVKDPTFKYVDDIICCVVDLCKEGMKQPIQETPGALCSEYIHPDKDEAIANHRSRFV